MTHYNTFATNNHTSFMFVTKRLKMIHEWMPEFIHTKTFRMLGRKITR